MANKTAPCLASPIILTTVAVASSGAAAGGAEPGLALAALPFACAGVDEEAEGCFSSVAAVPAPAAAGLDEGFRIKVGQTFKLRLGQILVRRHGG